MINRYLKNSLIESLKPGQVTVLFGARRVGKTTLMNMVIDSLKGQNVLVLNGEDFDVARVLASQREVSLRSLVAGYSHVFLDEAQNIPEIGKNLKLLVDSQPQVAVFATGSASFDLRNTIGAPLTGRSRYFILHPFSAGEITEGFLDATQKLPELLVYGTFPQVITESSWKEKRFILENIRNGYLLKDILQIDNIKDSLFIMNLLKLLALQVGNDVSANELAKQLSTTVKTIQRYLELLEKTFIIFRLGGFSKNLRKEISKSPRFYFWDNGIRNAIISNFNPVDLREDVGKLWENFFISERIKKQNYQESFSSFYFWRTYDQQEIDLIEKSDDKLSAFECKWGQKTARVPRAFNEAYPYADYHTINKDTFYEFLRF
jgi:predicted AAA+ superfamily ATPase